MGVSSGGRCGTKLCCIRLKQHERQADQSKRHISVAGTPLQEPHDSRLPTLSPC